MEIQLLKDQGANNYVYEFSRNNPASFVRLSDERELTPGVSYRVAGVLILDGGGLSFVLHNPRRAVGIWSTYFLFCQAVEAKILDPKLPSDWCMQESTERLSWRGLNTKFSIGPAVDGGIVTALVSLDTDALAAPALVNLLGA